MLLLPRWIRGIQSKKGKDNANINNDIECSKLLHMPSVARFVRQMVFQMYLWLTISIIGYLVCVDWISSSSSSSLFSDPSWSMTALVTLITTILSVIMQSNWKIQWQVGFTFLFSFLLALYVLMGADLPANKSVMHPEHGLYLKTYILVCGSYVIIASVLWWMVFSTPSYCSFWLQTTSTTQDNLTLAMNVVFGLTVLQLFLPKPHIDIDW